MIWESSYWKDPLLEAANLIEAYSRTAEPPEALAGAAEYALMTSFFAIRKLIDAKTKLTKETEAQVVSMTRHRSVFAPSDPVNKPNLMNWHDLYRFYDFETSHTVEKELYYACNQIVHSFIFAFVCSDDGKPEGILFSSDKDKDKFVNYMELDLIVRVFRRVGNDQITELTMSRDLDPNKKQSTGDWTIRKSV
ncbi:hypothetical protein MUY21_04100 [Aliiroseovarius sp. S2029]|uniref:hypothetical protein n=1 Tax=Aliiroseovarius sp. S2029 TaxID=2936988 RepID=UPI0020BEF9C2|nr:hypothetical protein [Aliiroseovarius sp. S2029]MCK8483211.1 hypothetical protein [Aliiroseovarius sp. S2029]